MKTQNVVTKTTTLLALLSLLAAAVASGTLGARAFDPPPDGGPINLGQPVTGSLKPGQSDVWNIHLKQGQFVRIEMSRVGGSNLDPEVAFAQEGHGTLATRHSTTGAGTVTLAANCLPDTGRYTITARSAQGHTGGRYTLKIDAVENIEELGRTTQPCAATDTPTDHTGDECGRALIQIHGPFGDPVRVQKGETKYVFIPDTGEIKWDCFQQGEFDDERAKCANGSNLVRIIRAPTGRHIDWTCYTRRFVH
jgi:hypothetical protein